MRKFGLQNNTAIVVPVYAFGLHWRELLLFISFEWDESVERISARVTKLKLWLCLRFKFDSKPSSSRANCVAKSGRSSFANKRGIKITSLDNFIKGKILHNGCVLCNPVTVYWHCLMIIANSKMRNIILKFVFCLLLQNVQSFSQTWMELSLFSSHILSWRTE